MGILEKLENTEDFYKRIDIVYNMGSKYVSAYPIHIFLLTSKEEISIFNKVNSYDNKFKANIESIDNNLFLLNYSRIWGDEKFEGYAYIFNYPAGWIIVSDNNKISPLEGLIKRLYPKVSPSYISSKEMYELCHNIDIISNKNDKYSSNIYYMTAKIPDEQTESIFKNVTINQMKEKIDRSFLIDKVKFRVKRDDKLLFDGLISRDGFCYFYNGDFTFFNENIAKPILSTGQKKLDFFSDLIKVEPQKDVISRPVELVFKTEFEPSSLKDLSKIIQNIDTLSLSVIHEGNPMLLIHAIDREDGSSFDITGVGKSIFLTPILETSGASLLKTSEHISRWFEEPIERNYHGARG